MASDEEDELAELRAARAARTGGVSMSLVGADRRTAQKAHGAGAGAPLDAAWLTTPCRLR